jgi:hypothetical protein
VVDPVQRLFADRQFCDAIDRVDGGRLMRSGVAFGTAANALHELARREKRLIVEKRHLRGTSPNGEREYVRDYQTFASGDMATALSAGKVVLTELVQTGLNDVLSRHMILSIKDGKLLTTSLRTAALPYFTTQQFSFLIKDCGFHPTVASLVWTAFGRIATDVPLDVLRPGQSAKNPGTIGSGIPVGAARVIDTPIQKGFGITIADLIFLATTTTTDYARYLEGSGVPVGGPWLAISAARLGGGSEMLWGFAAMAACVAGAGLFPGTVDGAACYIAAIVLLYWVIESLSCAGPASFVDA